MKPTRHIVKPNTSYWRPKHSVWFKKNDDDTLGKSYTRNQEILKHKQHYPKEFIEQVEKEEINERIKLAKQGDITWDMV